MSEKERERRGRDTDIGGREEMGGQGGRAGRQRSTEQGEACTKEGKSGGRVAERYRKATCALCPHHYCPWLGPPPVSTHHLL